MTVRDAAHRGAAHALTVALLVAVLPAVLPAFAAPETGEAQPAASGTPPPPAETPPPAAPGLKVIPDSYADAIGTWDLSRDGSNNRCTLVLSSDNTTSGRVVRFPAGCRRALPVLSNIVGWLFADGGIRLVDRNVRPLLQFAASKDRSSLTAKEGGATYALVPLQTVAMLSPSGPEPPASAEPSMLAAAPVAAPNADAVTAALRGTETPPSGVANAIGSSTREIPGSQPVLPAGVLVPSPAAATAPREKPSPEKTVAVAAARSMPTSVGGVPTPGVYALDRFSEKDVCRLELEQSRVAAKGAEALSAAHILPGCRDSGIAVFDPVSWRYANGHITLKAKRGHAVNLVPAGEGSWRRDPDVGTTFVLRKVER